jgi:hypothetical protein
MCRRRRRSRWPGRYPILLMMLAQSATDVLDEVVQMFDQAISAKFSAAERRMRDELAERGKTGENRQALLDELLAIITDTQIPDEEIGCLVRGEKIGWDRLRSAIAQAKPRLPRDHGHLAALDASYSYLRQFTPGGAVDGAVRRRCCGHRAADRGAHAAGAERHRHPQGPRGGPDRVRADQVARLPRGGPQVRQRHRLPAETQPHRRAAGPPTWV